MNFDNDIFSIQNLNLIFWIIISKTNPQLSWSEQFYINIVEINKKKFLSFKIFC